MKKSLKLKISKVLCGNVELNKQAMRIKRSWDEVEAILNRGGKPPKKGKCDPHRR